MDGAADAEEADGPHRRRNHEAEHKAAIKDADFVEQTSTPAGNVSEAAVARDRKTKTLIGPFGPAIRAMP